MGRYRGGSAKIAVTASCLFGMISGSAVSNVASVGVLTIPLMRRGGYPAHVAAAIEAVASTGGQLMPPVMGAAAFLMAEFLQVPYRDVAIAAALPALLYYYALFIQADLLAAAQRALQHRHQRRAAAAPGAGAGLAFPAAVRGAALRAVLDELVAGTGGARRPAALLVTGSTLGYGKTKLRPADVLARAVQGPDRLARPDHDHRRRRLHHRRAQHHRIELHPDAAAGADRRQNSLWLLLVLAALVSIILGMGMPTVGVYVLLAALVAPALGKVGLSPMASHMFVMYFGMMSMITPPVALAAYAAASLANTDAMKTGWLAMRFGWIAFVIPFLFIRSPSLLLIGSPTSIRHRFHRRAGRGLADLCGDRRLRQAALDRADTGGVRIRRPDAVHSGRCDKVWRMDRRGRIRPRRDADRQPVPGRTCASADGEDRELSGSARSFR